MASYLGDYPRSASNKEWKIVRAITSVLNQTCQDFELIIIADGCDKTVEIVKGFKDKPRSEKIRLFHIPKQKIWAGKVRNSGIDNAKGEWIVYLDIDDMFLPEHLERILKGIEENLNCNWLYFNDFSYDKKLEKAVEHKINIHKKGKCGTSNIAHKRSLNVHWPKDGNYMHDWRMIQNLKHKCKIFTEIDVPGYVILHVPELLDV